MAKNKQSVPESTCETEEQRHHLDRETWKPRHTVHLIEDKFQDVIPAARAIQLGFAMHEHYFLDQNGNPVFEVDRHG
jgi:hypothetical protein